MNSPQIDPSSIENPRTRRLVGELLVVLKEHYKRGPTHRIRVYESIEALAFLSGLTFLGADMDQSAFDLFAQTIRKVTGHQEP